MTIALSVLDLAPVSTGSTPQQAIRNTLDLARNAEAWGYRRYWLAEHHFASVASSATIELIGLVAAATSSIRVGSAAVQLGQHTAASVVEAFGTVDAVYPGRLDLGLGRSGHRAAEFRADATNPKPKGRQHNEVRNGVVLPPPFVGRPVDTSRLRASLAALQLPGAEPVEYRRAVADVRALLAGTYSTGDGVALHAVPGEGAEVELWLFGSSGGESAQLAGELGLPFVANYHVSPGTILETVAAYRAAFQPSQRCPEPYLVVSADVVVAAEAASARRLAAGYGSWVYSIRSGAGATEYRSPAEVAELTDEQNRLVADRLDTQFVGTPETVTEGLHALQQLTDANELVVTSVTHEHADRLTSHRLLAQAWGLPQRRVA